MSACAPGLDFGDLLGWLRTDDPARLAKLWAAADAVRSARVGDRIRLRGLVHLSNHCVRSCLYCGLRAGNRRLKRYRLSSETVLECARRARREGFDTVVLQAGEDPGWRIGPLAELVAAIKRTTGLAVALSLGERSPGDLQVLRQAGADRYLLKFETSDQALYRRLHLPGEHGLPSRIELLGLLGEFGYAVGSGVMVGLPGQSWASLAADLEWFVKLRLDMIAVGPWRPEPTTSLGRKHPHGPVMAADQAANSDLAARKVMALARLLCPRANLPATRATALAGPQASQAALSSGANVLMVDLTPAPQRFLYRIYPDHLRGHTEDPVERAVRWAREQCVGRAQALHA